jgi:hypothetical protein
MRYLSRTLLRIVSPLGATGFSHFRNDSKISVLCGGFRMNSATAFILRILRRYMRRLRTAAAATFWSCRPEKCVHPVAIRRATSGQVAILRGPLAVFMADMQTIKAKSIYRIQLAGLYCEELPPEVPRRLIILWLSASLSSCRRNALRPTFHHKGQQGATCDGASS